ncbi:MAG: aminodeoxychorismate lyase [Gammaproteobacteria bacterium]|nr:aminodeoxychorismate lyase [Gammaproteobacteria bacterium]
MVLINGKSEDRIAVADRGLQYGDGLFETIAFRDGIAEFIEAHLKRLLDGCKRLNIPFKQLELLREELAGVYQELSTSNAVIKIIITRGSGGRGYYADESIEPTRIISTHPLPAYPESHSLTGVSVRFCQHKLSESPSLAGIKHLNRLDNVLARSEWDKTDIAEGLMFDQSGNLIEGTMSNVFIVIANELVTPLLNKSGVAGIMRAQIIRLTKQLGLAFKERSITQDDLNKADEVFVCNSLNGIWPVIGIINIDKKYSRGTITQQLQHALSTVKK